jgi:hypothetical protein
MGKTRMNKTFKTATYAFLLLSAWTAAANASGLNWDRLGRAEAQLSRDHDTIRVSGFRDSYRRLKIKVKDAPLDLRRMVVVYDNGATENLNVRRFIPQGGETRPIDLRGSGKRSIRKVEFWYSTRGSGRGHSDVILYGLR